MMLVLVIEKTITKDGKHYGFASYKGQDILISRNRFKEYVTGELKIGTRIQGVMRHKANGRLWLSDIELV